MHFSQKIGIKKAHLATMAPHTLIRDRANITFSAHPGKTQCSSSQLEKNWEELRGGGETDLLHIERIRTKMDTFAYMQGK